MDSRPALSTVNKASLTYIVKLLEKKRKQRYQLKRQGGFIWSKPESSGVRPRVASLLQAVRSFAGLGA